MAINKLKKINVRSPYYITVDDKQEVIVVDSLEESTISCGSTVQVGIDVGTKTFKISTSGRELGDYDISFSNIKTPIKYRIGHLGNMPSFSTAGLDTYATEWNTATGESPSLSDFGANPNGVSATATYTSIQSDIDTYGEEIQLEIQQPIITEDYLFSLSCPDIAADETPVSSNKVVIISLINNERNSVGHQFNNITLNGQNLTEFSNIYANQTQRYVLSDVTPNIEPEDDTTYNPNTPSQQRLTGNNFFNKNQVGNELKYFRYEATTPTYYQGRVKAKHISSPLSSGINTLRITNDTTFTNNKYFSPVTMTVLISRHDVELENGVYYIRGSQDGFSAEALSVSFTLYAQEELDMSFEGSSEVPLETRATFIDRLSDDGSEFEDTQRMIVDKFIINPV